MCCIYITEKGNEQVAVCTNRLGICLHVFGPAALWGEKAGYSTVAMANAAPQPTWKLAAPVSSPSRIISLFPSTNCFFANVGGLLSSGAAEHCCRNQAERPHPRRARASGVWRGCKSTHFVCVCVCVRNFSVLMLRSGSLQLWLQTRSKGQNSQLQSNKKSFIFFIFLYFKQGVFCLPSPLYGSLPV